MTAPLTTSLELSKQLKEAGYPQDSGTFYYWCGGKKLPGGMRHEPFLTHTTRYSESSAHNMIAAPTVGELGEALPQKIEVPFDGNMESVRLQITHYSDGWYVNYVSPFESLLAQGGIVESRLEDAMTKMWLYLKKEGLL
jgi:hypothetical protein